VYSLTRSSSRADEMKSLGFLPIVADITNPLTLTDLPAAETVLFAVGMDRTKYDDIRMVYVDGLQNVLDRIWSETTHFIYVSSTGVYGDFGGQWIDENSPPEPVREGGKACLEAERQITSSRFGARATILRFAGIYGPGRVPTRQLIESKQWKRLSANGYLNLIYVDDGARIIDQISNQPPTGETFIVSDGHPPLRRDYYEFIANHFGLSEIPWEQSEATPENSRSGSDKRVSNQKLVDRFNVEFEFSDYKAGLSQVLDA
jgi:nucleoside-diphosphate-sugar epimerase